MRFLTIVFFFDIATAPLAKHVVTIIGNISGVNPTAIEIAKSKACIQLPLVNPFIKNTIGTIIIIKRISNHETELTPFSKLDSIFFSETNSLDIPPSIVLSPVAITIPIAEPLITLLPIKTKLFNSVIAREISDTWLAFFSIGSLSPVKDDWLTKKSLDSIILKSAGIISPAARYIMSPITTFSKGISFLFSPYLLTEVVVVIIVERASAALLLFSSWIKRRIPDIVTIVVIIITVIGEKSSRVLLYQGIIISVIVDTIAKQKSTAVKGFIKASTIFFIKDFLLPWVIIFFPNISKRCLAFSLVIPSIELFRSWKIFSVGKKENSFIFLLSSSLKFFVFKFVLIIFFNFFIAILLNLKILI